VRDGKGLHLNIANGKRCPDSNFSSFSSCGRSPFSLRSARAMPRASPRHEDRDAKFLGQHGQAVNVVGMFVRNKNGGERLRIFAQRLHAFESLAQEMPASTRMRVRVLATNAQFPRLPLASIETVTPMLQHT